MAVDFDAAGLWKEGPARGNAALAPCRAPLLGGAEDVNFSSRFGTHPDPREGSNPPW
jgi:hypothetical protein